MSTVEFKITLPDQLEQQARSAGLLTPAAIERLLREEIRRQQVAQLFVSIDRLDQLDFPPLSEEEVEAEIQAARQQRQA